MRPATVSHRGVTALVTLAFSGLLVCGSAAANCAPDAALLASAGLASSAPLAAPAAAPVPQARRAAPAAPADGGSREALAALARLQDADTALSLAAEGAALYARERVKLDGYAYCSQAVELADLGELRESARAASMALHVALETGNPDLLGKAYRDLSIAFSYAGQLERAEQFATLALKYPGLDPTQVLGPANKILGDVRARQGRYAEAIAYYDQAEKGSSPRFQPLVQASLANALIQSGDLARARSTLDAMPEPADRAQRAQLARTRGKLLLAENQPAQALAVFRQLADTPVDAAAGDGVFYRAWALDGMSRSQAALGDDAAAAASLDQALDEFERARAQFRSDDFKMGLFSDAQSVFERAIALHDKLGQVERAFDISERSRARALLDSIAGRADLNSNETTALDVQTLRAGLAPDEVVVAFHTLPDHLVAWVLTREGVREAHFPTALPRADLVKLVEAYRTALIGRNAGIVTASDQIGRLLLAPLQIPAGKRLLIVPHGPLHYLPFQALRLDGKYLIERNPVALAPSVSIAARLAAHAPQAQSQLLGFGNPTVAASVAAPLPGAEREVRALAADFPGARLFFGEQATRANFDEYAPQSQLVHVASHALVDTLDPLHSKVLFTDGNGQPVYLEAKDVMALKLDGVALLTLSACESGLGRVENGDEVLGFTRAFLSAGTSSLLASLWPVSDAATEKLMTTFYGDLAHGANAQDAMRDAQRAVLANPATAHPYYWAPFNLIGNWRLRVMQ